MTIEFRIHGGTISYRKAMELACDRRWVARVAWGNENPFLAVSNCNDGHRTLVDDGRGDLMRDLPVYAPTDDDLTATDWYINE